jgi:glycogen debranching enzyme
MNSERQRLEAQRKGQANWRLWGPYLAERAWGTVREDYSPYGTAWESFDHDQARSRAYRWNEDGMGGICDEKQRLCLALALWNGQDPILKERAFGLTGNQGNRGEDVKEYYFYLDGTPTHSYLRYMYKYPQAEYPYRLLLEENRRRTRKDPPYTLLDTGVFRENRYWDVEVEYAKSDPQTVLMRITAHNRGPDDTTLHVLPTLWFRNTWSWGDENPKPKLVAAEKPAGAAWAVFADHPELGLYHLYGAQPARLLFTENETSTGRLWGIPNSTPFVKDGFHRRVIHADEAAVNPEAAGTKFAAWHELELPAGASAHIDLVLCAHTPAEHYKGFIFKTARDHFEDFDRVVAERQSEADEFYREILPEANPEEMTIFRQALAGLIWSKQFFHYDVARWLDGDIIEPPYSRKWGRNSGWRHLKAADVFIMPDPWEYPWFAAWDLAFHAVAMALIDVDFAKEQLELLLTHRYLHPNGQIPAYEWSFDDVNPPVHAWAALECFRAERAQRGKGDLKFLRRVFNKLLLNYGWWLNQKDPDNRGVFQGGFLGLDNISVYDRSQPLPQGFSLKQADASGWMAMFALNLTTMAIELAQENPEYEDLAIQIHGQFFAIANAIHGHTETGVALWDPADQFFKDAVDGPFGIFPLPVFSWVGLIPLFGIEIASPQPLVNMPRYTAFLKEHAGGKFDGNVVCACPHTVNVRNEHLFSLPLPTNLPAIMGRVLNSDEFLSPYGIRALSKVHAARHGLGEVPGLGETMIAYEPGESESGLFGGNSNWRGPIWFPLNYVFVLALDRLHQYLTESFEVPAPALGMDSVTFAQAADLISERLIGIFRRNEQGLRPEFDENSPFQIDPHWKDLLLFYEYFNGEDGRGLGAAHQTGWTALVANLIKRKFDRASGIRVRDSNKMVAPQKAA